MKHTFLSTALLAASTVSAAVMKRQAPTTVSLVPQVAPGWTSMGCYSDDPNNRTLAQLVGVGQGIDNTQCQEQCNSLGYTFAGNEDGGQCYCDNIVNPLATSEPASDCDYTCPANQTQPCGALNRINVFALGPSQTYDIPGWSFYGCLTDSVYSRALGHAIRADDMTPQTCATACADAGFTLSGVEFSSECYCDNFIQNNQTLASVPSSCNMACQGNSSQACGGPGRLDLFYINGSPPQAQQYKPHAVDLPVGWSNAGCYSDDVQARALANYIVAPESGMTVEFCVNGCASYNYTFAGLENGDECYCGLSLDHNQTVVEDGCTTPCSGDNSENCGGPARLSLFSTIHAAPKQCNNQGLQYAAYNNPYYNTDPPRYPTFTVDPFKTSGDLIYSDVTTTIGGIYNDCSSGGNIFVYGSSKAIPCLYHVLNHRGYIYAPISGTYTFIISSVDDIVLFWMGANALSGWERSNADAVVTYGTGNCDWTQSWTPGCGSFQFTMTAGQYLPIRILFGQAQGQTSFQLALHAPDGRDLLDSNSVASPNIVQYSCDGTSAPAFPGAFGAE